MLNFLMWLLFAPRRTEHQELLQAITKFHLHNPEPLKEFLYGERRYLLQRRSLYSEAWSTIDTFENMMDAVLKHQYLASQWGGVYRIIIEEPNDHHHLHRVL